MEFWDVYDAQGNRTGRVKPKGAAFAPDERHLAMEAWIINGQGEILLQRRSDACELLPGLWGLTTGRMLAGEDSRAGCVREVWEELGLAVRPEEPRLLRRIIRRDLIWDVYRIDREADLAALRLQPEEVSDVRWVTPAGLRAMVRAGEVFEYPEIYALLDEVAQGK